AVQVRLLPDALSACSYDWRVYRPVTPGDGFDSRTGRCGTDQVVERHTHRAENPGPTRDVRVRLSPWSLDAKWTGAWLPARSHKAYDPGSNPGFATVPLTPDPSPPRGEGRKMAKWWNEQTREAQNFVPARAWECNSPLGHSTIA